MLAERAGNVDAPTDATADERVGWVRRNPSTVAFTVVATLAVPALAWFGRDHWFFLDEWDFLSDRRLSDPGDLFRPHNEHWSTIPIVVYRLLFRGFALRSYLPYQLVLIGLHVASAALLRMVMRRAGVDGWIATAGATVFLFFGAGHQNILWAFQIGFTGSLLFGLVHLLAADHDGPLCRRDGLGLVAGACSLASSGVGVAMVVGVGASVLFRRGWRAAAMHTLPLAAIYFTWLLLVGGAGVADRSPPSVSNVVTVQRTAYARLVEVIGGHAVTGAILAAAALAGIAWSLRARDVDRRRWSAALGLAAFGLTFITIVGFGRPSAFGGDASRYLHLLAAGTIPLWSLGLDRLAERSRLPAAVLAVALLMSLPGNIATFHDDDRAERRVFKGSPTLVAAMVYSPALADAPADAEVGSYRFKGLDAGFLRYVEATSGIGQPADIPARVRRAAALELTVHQYEELRQPVGCERVRSTIVRRLASGDRIRFVQPQNVMVELAVDGDILTDERFTVAGNTIEAVGESVRLAITPRPPANEPVLVCDR